MGTVVYRQLDEIETVSTALRLLWSINASTAMTIGASAFAAPGPGVADGPALQARKDAWPEAYRCTPHGKPVRLESDAG